MAIAGGASPALEVWLKDGVLKTGFHGHANSAVVVEDVAEVYRRIVNGERIYMHRFGMNFVNLKQMVEEGEKGNGLE